MDGYDDELRRTAYQKKAVSKLPPGDVLDLAVAFFKENGPGDWRVSMRSKGAINVNDIAREFGGGGHTNASGCSARGDFADLKMLFEGKLTQAIEAARQ